MILKVIDIPSKILENDIIIFANKLNAIFWARDSVEVSIFC